MVYLNSACLNAIAEYLAVRPEPPKDADKPYLFVSSRTRAPLTPRRVEQIVETHLKAAGLGGRGYSPHKLRHTAATIMYQNNCVDIRDLKESIAPTKVGFPSLITSINIQDIMALALASAVVINACAASPFAANALPALNPNHPKRKQKPNENQLPHPHLPL